MRKILPLLFMSAVSTAISQTTVTYDITINETVGLNLTSGDMCSPPYVVEEAKQITAGNSWGATWQSTNSGTPSSIEVSLSFTSSDATNDYPTTLNGSANNMVNSGPQISCSAGTPLTWQLNPTGYNSMGTNTFLVDYSSSSIVNQLDDMGLPNEVYMQVTVVYDTVPDDTSTAYIHELIPEAPELVKITDLMGREIPYQTNTPLLYVYSNGTVRKVFIKED